MKNLRDVFLACVLMLFSTSMAYSQKISDVGFDNPRSEGIGEDTLKRLNPYGIRSKFEQIFREYAPTITVYDISNEEEMMEWQTKVGNIGEMGVARGRASILLLQIGQYISIQLRIVDANTNAILGSSDYKISLSDIEDSQKIEVAIGTICVHVFENLGIILSSTQVSILNGEKSTYELSSAEMDAEVKSLDDQLLALQKNMDELKKKEDEDVSIQLDKLEIAQNKLKAKREIEIKRLERKREDERRKQEEEESLAQRSKEATERIQAQTKKYELYATKVRKEQMKSNSSYEQIQIVEKIKQNMLSTRIMKNEQIEEFNKQEREYAESECEKIDDTPFASIDKDANGEPLPERVAERNEKKRKIREESETRIEKFRLKTEKQQEDFEKKILANINQNYAIMKKNKTVNSVNDVQVLRLRVGNYDGGKYGWLATVSFDLGLANIAEYQILIPYKALFNKKPNISSVEYRENVEDYDSFFRNNIPVVYVSVDYSIVPLGKDEPSKYVVTIAETSIYKIDTESSAPPKKIYTDGKILQGVYVAEVISDIRTAGEKKVYAEKLRKEELKHAQIAEKERRSIEKERQKIEHSYERTAKNEARKQVAKAFFKPAWYFGINVGLQTYKFDVDTTRAFVIIDAPVYPLFLGLESTVGKSSSLEYQQGVSLKDAFNRLDSNLGIRLGYRMLGAKQGWFSPYFCVSGGVSVVDIDASTLSNKKENLSGYVAGTCGVNFLSTLGLFGLSYSCEWNSKSGKVKHLLGVSVGVNLISEK